jgi:hypothetical protein
MLIVLAGGRMGNENNGLFYGGDPRDCHRHVFVLPRGSLPALMSGYYAYSTRIHELHAMAAVTGVVVFLLIGLAGEATSLTPGSTGPRSHQERCARLMGGGFWR